MRLCLTARSERGKELAKTGNESITITLTENRRQRFDLTFTGDEIKVMRYGDGSIETIEYIKTK